MSSVSQQNVNQESASPLWFKIARVANGGFSVVEHAGAARGEFQELSEAMRFATEEAASRGKKAKIRFDASLALIRAAG